MDWFCFEMALVVMAGPFAVNAKVNLDATRHAGKRHYVDAASMHREPQVLATLSIHDQRPGQGRQLAQAICYIDEKWVTHKWPFRCLSCRRSLNVNLYLERVEPQHALGEILPRQSADPFSSPEKIKKDTLVQTLIRFGSRDLYREVIRMAEKQYIRTRVFRCPGCGISTDTRLVLERAE